MNNFTKFARSAALAAAMSLAAVSAQASVIFAFTEEGGNVVMRSSGTLDTNKMVLGGTDGWGNTGIEENGNHDIMGGTSFGQNDISFGFNQGTDFSQWASPNGPWSSSNFNWNVDSGSKSFATFLWNDNITVQLPGMSMVRSDIENDGTWTPDQMWTNFGETFASLNMFAGTYTVADAVTGESITFQIGDANVIPLPAALPLLGAGFGLMGLMGWRKKRSA